MVCPTGTTQKVSRVSQTQVRGWIRTTGLPEQSSDGGELAVSREGLVHPVHRPGRSTLAASSRAREKCERDITQRLGPWVDSNHRRPRAIIGRGLVGLVRMPGSSLARWDTIKLDAKLPLIVRKQNLKDYFAAPEACGWIRTTVSHKSTLLVHVQDANHRPPADEWMRRFPRALCPHGRIEFVRRDQGGKCKPEKPQTPSSSRILMGGSELPFTQQGLAYRVVPVNLQDATIRSSPWVDSNHRPPAMQSIPFGGVFSQADVFTMFAGWVPLEPPNPGCGMRGFEHHSSQFFLKG
ncbi:hypothetical protein B0H16DRAFT_1459438 [Mycena metata]|uniref:Uncharacterized protein n=1 Tax=Mycena metata TaxID=1033252 RepID=A0AAD7J134_9AGAR|nr:hypothetical protein B0H16DRAFT_1459438 [Mycena metata]